MTNYRGTRQMRILFLPVVLLLLAACGESAGTPEDEIRAWVASAESAVEAEDRSGLLDMISVDYADGRGQDRTRIGELLRAYFFRNDEISLLVSIDDMELSGATAAQVLLTVGMAGSSGNAFGFSADAYNFELELHKPDEEWLLLGASWGELGGRLQ